MDQTAQDITVPVIFPMPPLSFSDVKKAGEDYIRGIRNIKISVDGQIVTPQSHWTVVLDAPQEEITDKLQQALDQLMATQGPAGNLRQNRMDVVLTGNPARKEGNIGEFTLRLHGDAPPAFSRR